jgi:hypothetical protein
MATVGGPARPGMIEPTSRAACARDSSGRARRASFEGRGLTGMGDRSPGLTETSPLAASVAARGETLSSPGGTPASLGRMRRAKAARLSRATHHHSKTALDTIWGSDVMVLSYPPCVDPRAMVSTRAMTAAASTADASVPHAPWSRGALCGWDGRGALWVGWAVAMECGRLVLQVHNGLLLTSEHRRVRE